MTIVHRKTEDNRQFYYLGGRGENTKREPIKAPFASKRQPSEKNSKRGSNGISYLSSLETVFSSGHLLPLLASASYPILSRECAFTVLPPKTGRVASQF